MWTAIQVQGLSEEIGGGFIGAIVFLVEYFRASRRDPTRKLSLGILVSLVALSAMASGLVYSLVSGLLVRPYAATGVFLEIPVGLGVYHSFCKLRLQRAALPARALVVGLILWGITCSGVVAHSATYQHSVETRDASIALGILALGLISIPVIAALVSLTSWFFAGNKTPQA